jgi:arsenite/tail-anchored protein-transporting ATPase
LTTPQTLNDLLTQRRFLLVTGKGGIGKTLISCALARRAIELGRRVLVVEQSAVEQVGPLLGMTGIAHEEQWIGSLGVANFTPAGNFKDFVTKHLMKSNLLDIVISNKVVHSFFTAIPGFSELMLLGRIYYAMNLAPKLRPDLVIMDSYASGHFLSLMTTPDAVLQSGLAGPIVHQTTLVKNWLADRSECATVLVGVPEDLVVSEMLEFLPILAKRSPVSLGGIVLNRCWPVDSNVNVTTSELTMKDFILSRRNQQSLALQRLERDLSDDVCSKDVPKFFVPELGSIDEPLSSNTIAQLLGGL